MEGLGGGPVGSTAKPAGQKWFILHKIRFVKRFLGFQTKFKEKLPELGVEPDAKRITVLVCSTRGLKFNARSTHIFVANIFQMFSKRFSF